MSNYIPTPTFHNYLTPVHHLVLPWLASSDVPLNNLPEFHGRVAVYTSAVATYYAPSDLSGTGGMHPEWIQAVQKW